MKLSLYLKRNAGKCVQKNFPFLWLAVIRINCDRPSLYSFFRRLNSYCAIFVGGLETLCASEIGLYYFPLKFPLTSSSILSQLMPVAGSVIFYSRDGIYLFLYEAWGSPEIMVTTARISLLGYWCTLNKMGFGSSDLCGKQPKLNLIQN